MSKLFFEFFFKYLTHIAELEVALELMILSKAIHIILASFATNTTQTAKTLKTFAVKLFFCEQI